MKSGRFIWKTPGYRGLKLCFFWRIHDNIFDGALSGWLRSHRAGTLLAQRWQGSDAPLGETA